MTGGQDGCGSESEFSQTVQSGGFGYHFNSSDMTEPLRDAVTSLGWGWKAALFKLAALVRQLQRVHAAPGQSRTGPRGSSHSSPTGRAESVLTGHSHVLGGPLMGLFTGLSPEAGSLSEPTSVPALTTRRWLP